MQGWEQQINNQLTKVEEQEELNFIRWQLSNSTKKSFYLPKHRNEGISQWVQHRPLELSPNKQRLLSLFSHKPHPKNTSYKYALEALSEESDQTFLKYDSKAAYFSVRKEDSKRFSPKRINLKLPMPQFLEKDTQDRSTDNHQSSLPIIRKLSIPIRNLRNAEKKKDKSLQETGLYPPLLKDIDREDGVQEPYRKGRMLGTTRRLFKNNYNPKSERQSLNCSELQECITFRK